jgi:hypothetical protein
VIEVRVVVRCGKRRVQARAQVGDLVRVRDLELLYLAVFFLPVDLAAIDPAQRG